jgi:nucleoid-associated protein YgaU
MSSTKSIIDEVLNTAVLASFAIPEVGAVTAAGIGTVGLLFNLFYTDAPTGDPSLSPVDKQDLQNAVTEIANLVDDKLWQANISVNGNSVLDDNEDLLSTWKKLARYQLDKLVVPESTPGANDGDEYIRDKPNQSDAKDLEGYFFGSSKPDLRPKFTFYRNPGDASSTANQLAHRKAENTGPYCLAASNWISFDKAKVLWEWSHNVVLKYNRYQAFLKDSHYRLNAAYASSNPVAVEDPLEKNPPEDPPTGPPDWNDWKTSGPVADMLDHISEILLNAEGDGTDDNPGLYTTLVRSWYKDRPQNVADRLSKLSIQTNGSNYWYVDSDPKAGGTSPWVTNRHMAEVHMEGKAGALIAYWWDNWSNAYAIENIKEDALTGFAEVIQLWKQGRASVTFSASDPVAKGDTLNSIAKKHYGSELYNKAIFDFNRTKLQPQVKNVPNSPLQEWERVTLNVGQVLSLPAQEDVDFFLYTLTADDQYFYTICEKFFYDRNLRGPLDDANGDIADPTSAGAVIRIPVLPETPQIAAKFTFYRVKKGDTLGSIAAAQYGSDLYSVVILDANRCMLRMSDYNVAGVTLKEDMILRLLDRADVGFSFYTVQKGDTLKTIATSQYGSWLYSLAIYDANKHVQGAPGVRRGAYWDQVVLTAGDVLKIADKANVEANDFFLYQLAPSDDYPDGIASHFYGDSSLAGFVKNMNADVSNPGIGTQIRLSVEGLITH